MTRPAPPVTGVDFVSLPTQNLDRACDFHRNVVGQPSAHRPAERTEADRASIT
jgi:hypothetical protein